MMSKKIGYSCWGFLGNGIVDTPDGGRSHRATLIKGLIKKKHTVVMLQSDRDKFEADDPISLGQTYESGFPEIDVLFLEWRWLIPGRNDNPDCLGYTPDLHRQRELLEYYLNKGIPIIVWDKDQKLHSSPFQDRELLLKAKTYVLEPSLYPSAPDRISCLFPVNLDTLSTDLEKTSRDIPLIYIGNQYERDDVYRKYLVDASRYINVHVYGKWTHIKSNDNLFHHKRVGFSEVAKLYRKSFATVLLAPIRYMKTGQFTQRIFEAAQNGCIPLVPKDYKGSQYLLPPFSHVSDGLDVAKRVKRIMTMSGSEWRILLTKQIGYLEPFSIQNTLEIIEQVMRQKAPRFKGLKPAWSQ